MNIRLLWRRSLAAVTSLLVLAPSALTPFSGMMAAAEETAYDTTYMVAHFSQLEKTYRSADTNDKILYSNWQYADGANDETGIDMSKHDPSKLEIRMTMTLAVEGDASVDAGSAFRGGYIKLRSLDRSNVEDDEEAADGNREHNVGFSINPLGLQLGDNYISLSLAEWYQNNWINTKGVLDMTTINRMNIYIDTVPKDIAFTMTLSDVCVVDTTNESNTSPRVAVPSEGMSSMDKIVYSIDATEQGADKTGTMDSTAAIQRSIQKVRSGGVVFLPAGRYKVNGTLQIPGGVTLRGEWVNPEKGGIGKGTILMAYAGKGNTDPTDTPFISMSSSACLRDISIWYPEQDAAAPIAYPATIYGDSHTDVINVTLYNSYYGFYNNSCSSMLIRQLYGTVLYRGIHGAYAYDIPRIENVHFDTKYWADSGFDGAPSGSALTLLNTYAENNLIAVQAGEQDWGYWYDLNINHAKYGIFLTAVPDDPGNKVVPGNIAAGKVTTRNTQIGVYMENVGYPGFQLTYSDIEATEYGMYYAVKPDYSAYQEAGMNVAYYDNATIAVSTTAFKGGKAGIWSDKAGGYGINLNDCTFEDWSQYAIRLSDGHLTVSNSEFKANKTPFYFTSNVKQVILGGNSFAASTIVSGNGWSNTDSRIRRDDNTSIPHTPDYDYTYISDVKPTGDAIFNVMDYGAVAGSYNRIPAQDSTDAFQQALNAAGGVGGGTVYVPAGVYRIEGALSVPTGVELRGTFESAHYGNGTWRGTQLYAYGNKDNENGLPLITLSEGAGVKGFTVFYPEQGYSDRALVAEEKVHAYPPTVRANKNTWIQNMAMIATYTAIDAMTNNCDNIVITDVTGAAMYATLEMGHGTTGGYVQNLHFNYSGWVQQGAYENRPRDNRLSADGVNSTNALATEFTTRVTKGLILGDVTDVNFFSCFNIIVAEQIVLEKDPHTGGDFEGTMWGVAFDAATNGVVGREGSKADLTIVSSMGVFNRQGGGYNVKTDYGFSGKVSLFNADAWDAASNLAYVEGGTVNLVQYFSWCVYNGVCKAGGTLNVYGSTIISNNGDGNGRTPDFTYENGATGQVIGNLDCKQKLNIVTQPGSYVEKKLNGADAADATPEPVNKSDLKTLLDGRRTEDRLIGYTEESIETYNALFDTAQAVYDNAAALSVEIAAQINILKTADNVLKREMKPGELLMVDGTIDSKMQHYMSVNQTFATPIDLTKYSKNGLSISLEVRVNKLEESFPELLKDMPAEEWIKYIVNGSLILWAGDTRVNVSDLDTSYRLSCGQEGQLKDAVVGEYIVVTFPIPEAIVEAGQITKFEFYLYNDLHNPLNRLDPADPPKYKDYGEGVSITVKDMTLHFHAEVEADKTLLNAAIAEAQKINTADYTPNSVTPFKEALDTANRLSADTSALQEDVNNAAAALTAAQNALVKKADKSALNDAITAAAQIVDTSRYTETTAKAFITAQTKAKVIAANDNASQAQVDEATNALIKAQEGLVEKANKIALNEAIAAAEARQTDGKVYSPETLAALNDVLIQAKALVHDDDVTQTTVDTTVESLNAAVSGLRYRMGDVDGDGEVTAADALLALQAATGKIALDTTQQEAADVDGDANRDITANDALLMLQYATKKITAFQTEE